MSRFELRLAEFWRNSGGSLAEFWRQHWRKSGGILAEVWRNSGGNAGGSLAEVWRKSGGSLVAFWWNFDMSQTEVSVYVQDFFRDFALHRFQDAFEFFDEFQSKIITLLTARNQI